MNRRRLRSIRVLVAGCGSIGRRHARLLAERPDVDLSICEPVEANRRETQSALSRPAREFSDYAAALAAGPHLVVICTPDAEHVSMGLVAARTGADVLVEKPIAKNVRDARRLVRAAAAAGCLLHVGYMLRYDPGLNAMHRLVAAGKLGRLCAGRAHVGSYITLLNGRDRTRETRPGSLVVDYSHEFDFIRWFFGDVAAVKATAATLGRRVRRADPNIFQALLQMRSGALVQVHLDYLQFPQRRTFEIMGDRGTLSYDFMTGEIRHFPYGREHRWRSLDVPPLPERVDELFRAEHAAVLRCVRTRRPSRMGGADGIAALLVAEQALAAAGDRGDIS